MSSRNGEMQRICVFCGCNTGKSPLFTTAAAELGHLIGSNRKTLVYGGGSTGLMGILAESCLDSGGRVVGIVPEHLDTVDMVHQNLDKLLVVSSMFERKSEMERLSDAFIVLPGGYGTIDELFEMITLCQLRQHSKPVIILNIGGYFDPLLQQIRLAVDEGFISREHGELLQVSNSSSQLFKLLAE